MAGANVVAKAAWHHLVAWIDHGTLPPIAPRLALTTATPPALQRDANGIVEGGVRTPPLDVPTRVLSGAKGPSQDVICLLAGSTLSISPAQLTQWYGTRQAFQRRYDAAIDRAVKAGYILGADRKAIQAYAHPELVPS